MYTYAERWKVLRYLPSRRAGDLGAGPTRTSLSLCLCLKTTMLSVHEPYLGLGNRRGGCLIQGPTSSGWLWVKNSALVEEKPLRFRVSIGERGRNGQQIARRMKETSGIQLFEPTPKCSERAPGLGHSEQETATAGASRREQKPVVAAMI